MRRTCFRKIADEEKSPLQVMISSLETQKTTFLASQGFKKARISHEMEVKKQDLLKGLSSGESKIFNAIRGQKTIESVASCFLITIKRLTKR